MAHLILMFKDKTLQKVPVGKEPVRIGRDRSNHIQIDNPAVSRFHAEVYKQGYPFFIEDKNSTNGVQVNGIRVSWKDSLRDGDTITIGKHTLLFREDQDTSKERKKADPLDIDGTVKIGKD